MTTIADQETIDWIAVTDEMPDDDISVLVFAPNSPDWQGEQVWIGHYDTGVWIDTEGSDWPESVVTHWAAMPAGPSRSARETQP